MPKDPTRNQPNYKIGGSHLNEFEFARNQGAMTEAEHERFQQQQAERQAGEGGAGDESAPQTEAERIQQLMADVHEQVQRRKERAQAGAGKPARKGGAARTAGAKKTGTKAAKKTGAKATKRTGAKAAKRSGAKTAKKTGAKGAKRSGAQLARGAGRKAAAAKKAGGGRKAGAAKGGAKKGVRRSAR
jgi:hypothetical protein